MVTGLCYYRLNLDTVCYGKGRYMDIITQFEKVYENCRTHMTDIPVDQVLDFEKGLLEYMDSKCDDVLTAIRTEKVLTEDIEAGLVKAITEYKKVFLEENKR